MDLSVVVPVCNESGNVLPLIEEITEALQGKILFEIVYVDDGSTDQTMAELRNASQTYGNLRVIQHLQRCGQSAAIRTGVKEARGNWIATLDGDGQNDPHDLPNLWDCLQQNNQDGKLYMVSGQRVKRQDKWSKRFASRWANKIRAKLLKDNTPDTGCGIKIFKRDVFLDYPYFDHMHRYIAALTLRQGGRVMSVPVNHRHRTRGASKYGFWDRLAVGIADMLGVMWLQRRASIPAYVEVSVK